MKIEHDIANFGNFTAIGNSRIDSDGVLMTEVTIRHKAHDPRDSRDIVLDAVDVRRLSEYWTKCYDKASMMFDVF